ncbi:MAG TPA: putative PEP-binding protein [Candidatus Obscuribacterales bacterium]
MPSFYALDTIADLPPWQTGEMAQLLYQLQQMGHDVPPTWVIPATHFQQTLASLIPREPIYAEWPQLLWQTASVTGYPVQHLAKRLRRPLLTTAVEFPWADLLAAMPTLPGGVVRLLPSLWLGENLPTAPFAQMLGTPLCWAEPEALEATLKHLWLAVLNAKSLAFWSQWRKGEGAAQGYPQRVEMAVLVQGVMPTVLSGTLSLRAGHPAVIQAVQGLPTAIAESCPDTWRGALTTGPPWQWQPGYQEQCYHPAALPPATPALDPCLVAIPVSQTAGEVMTLAIEQDLWALANTLQSWASQPLHVEWGLAAAPPHLQIAQAQWWPLQAWQRPAAPPAATPAPLPSGHGASSGQGQGRALILRPGEPLPATAEAHIIVATEVMPDWLPLLKTAVGVISERGGLTCHAAVLARELGLPAVVGVQAATQRFKPGEALHIDGDRGIIEFLARLPDSPRRPVERPPLTVPVGASKLWLNLSQPEAVTAIAALPVAGVGLLRSEWLMTPVLDRRHPYHWVAQGEQARLLERLLTQLRPIVQAFAPRPVRYRTLDIRTNEFAQLIGAPPVESNPMLGLRGAFSYRQYPALLHLELQLLKRLQNEGYTNLQLLLPFVRTVEDVTFCQTLVQAVGLDQEPGFELWMMAEVPSVLFSLPSFAATGIHGIAIGTHDLTQLLLGIDRDQALFSSHFNETHPAVLAAIAQLIQQAQALKLDCCLCGASPTHHPEFVTALLQHNVANISVDVAALAATTRLLQQTVKG